LATSQARLRLAAPVAHAATTLTVHGLGPLCVVADGRPLGRLTNRRARSVLAYLLLHRGRGASKDVLMDLIWPDAAPAAARNSLHVALHGLRRHLRGSAEHGEHVLFQDDVYLINPEIDLWLDIAQFDRHRAAGRRLSERGDIGGAVRELEAAEVLYRGRLFEDDLYEEWMITPRQAAEDSYVEVLAGLAAHYRTLGDDLGCVRASRKVLTVQPMYEAAHRHLMHAYARLDQHHLALRQYRECVSVLRVELRVPPAPETTRLNELIRLRRIV
jgi:DNA-binding SARP family transcriptional activator